MAYTIPKVEPKEFVLGDDLDWDATFPDFPASDGWQLTYWFVALHSTDAFSAVTGTHITANGDFFEVRIPDSVTSDAARSAGTYKLTPRLTLSGEVRSPLAGYPLFIQAHPDPTSEIGAISHNRAMLSAIETELQAWGTKASKKKIAVNGRTVEFADQDALVRLRDHYKTLVVLEDDPDLRLFNEVHFI